METQKFMGRNQLVKRLIAQVGDKGFAYALLKKRGHMNPDGTLTAEGCLLYTSPSPRDS